MEEDLYSFGKQLTSFIEKNQYHEAEKFIIQINKTLTSFELSPFTIDTYFLNIFNESTGLLHFLKQILYNPEYKKVKISCFELLYTIVNNFNKKIEKHLLAIIKTCAPVVRSSASAIEKEKSLNVLILVLKKGHFYACTSEDVEKEISLLYKDTLFNCLCNRFDKSVAVQERLFVAIGFVTKKFPSVIMNSNELCNNLVNRLSKELQSKDKSLPVITGCLSALSNFLENFTFNSENDKAMICKVYNCAKTLADPQDSHRKVAYRENLSFISNHIILFAQLIYPEAEWWHQTLIKWFSFGVEDKKAAYKILESFTQEMANILSTQDSVYDRHLFKYFMDYFNNLILESSAENYEMQLAIRGLGLLAKSFKLHITPVEINRLFVTISQILENNYILNNKIDPEQLIYLPHYIQTLSFIISNLPELHSNHIVSLQLISILLIKIFPQLSTIHHHLVIDAFVIMLYQLLTCKQNILELFLENVIHQGVLWTCSHQIALDAELLKETNQNVVTYKHYLPFWHGLLNIVTVTKYEKYEINTKSRSAILKKLINELIKTLFLLINKINLGTKLIDENNPITDPAVAYQPIETNDFVMFVNIVDFYQAILENMNLEMFNFWVIIYINRILNKSIKYPLISGFYKLLASCLRNCEKLNYFNDSSLANEEVQMCHYTLMKFAEDMLCKMKQYKDDLQVACLHLIMTIPVSIIRELLPSISSVFLVLFSIGRSYLQLANLGVDALEKWVKLLPATDIEPVLKQVLPSLDSYLRSRSLGGSLESNIILKHRKTKKLLSKRKILVQTEPELLKLQMKIMSFIGQLNNNLCMTFVSNEDNESVIFNNTSYLAVVFPYNNKLPMSMDRFVPRVVELSLYCSDRKMRVVACELLHAFILITLGTSKVVDPGTLKNLDYLIRTVASPILKLACDMDEVIKQLFSSLAIQMMHYYSRPDHMETSHSHIVIEALMDAITNPTDSNLRDFSGKCIHEFVKWTIKQADRNDLLKNPKYIKIWIQHIQAFSVHTDPFKRLGAALIFNNIYTLLREETYMFNMFWLELFHVFVMNLSLTQVKNVDDNNCIDQVLQALNHLERGFVEKSNNFNDNDSNRRKPPDLDGVLLKDVVGWLLKGTSSNNWHCRAKCMSMFCKIAPLVSGCNNSLKKYNDLYFTANPEWICDTYESDLIATPTLKELKDSTSTDSLFKWFQSLLCALDGYIFVVNNNFLPTKFVSEKSQLFTAIIFFLDHVMLSSINDVAKNIPNSSNIIYSAAEKEHYNYVKAKVVIKLMHLLIALVENNKDLTYAKIENEFLWKHNLGNFICHRIFDPLSMGFDLTDDIQDVIKFLNTISGFASDNILLSLNTHIYSYINKFSTRYSLSSNVVPFKERLLLKGLLILNQSCLSNKINLHFFNVGTVDVIKTELIENRDNKAYIKNLHKTAKEFCELKLQLALCNKEELLLATQLIFEKSLITDEKTRKEVKYGSYFYQTFKDVLLKFLFENYAMVLEKIFTFETGDNIFSYVFDLLKYARENSENLQHQIEAAVETSLNKWGDMILYFNENFKSRMLGLEFLSKLAKISTTPFCDILQGKLEVIEWVISLLNYEEVNWTEENSLSIISEVINVLPCVLGKFDVYSTEISNAFQNIKKRYYMDTKITNKRIVCVTTFKKLLDAVKYSKSKILLRAALDIYISTPYLNKDIDLDDTLKSFIRHLSVDQQINALNLVYQMCFSINQYTYSHCYILAKKAMPSLIQHCYYNAYEKFYINTIETIKVCVGLNINADDYSNDEIVNKIINFILVEVLFFRIKTDRFQDNTCNISKAAFPIDPPSTKKMLKFFTGSMIQTSKESYNLESEEDKNMFRLYQCHAYNTLISLISNTQTNIDFYNALFIREDVWSKIVDTDRKYIFEIEFELVPAVRKVLINIRGEMLNKKRTVDHNARTVNYIQSQHLFKSTLNEDVTKFDFTHSVLRSQPDEQIKIENTDATQELGITLEELQINFHECMAPICAVIQHMVDADINSLTTDGSNVLLPKWMKGIKNVLMTEDIHNNIKIFLVKVIHNCQHIFKYYAQFFYAPILKFITDGVIGNDINFFVTDLIVMLMSWSSIALPSEDTALASSLLRFLMLNCDNDVKNIFKYNLEQIKLVIETWKAYLEIPYDIVYAKLQLSEESQKLDVGVHLAATILANNIAPWVENELKNFLMTLSKILKNSHIGVYQPCSEVLGMALNFISRDAKSYRHLEKFKEYLHKQLEKLSSDDNKFAYCLQGITLHYPDIANNYLVKLNSKLNLVQGNFKNIYLKIFLTRVDELQMQNELSSIDFRSLLLEENLETQELALEIIKKSILYLKIDQQLLILKEVANFVNNSSTKFRMLMYEIFIIIYDDQSQQAEEITELSKDILLQGLVDKETIIREKLFTFWASDDHLPKSISNAFLYLLNFMYKPDIEENYVCYSAYFLLNLLKETEEYSEKLFKYPLYNCDFQDYNLVSDWRRQHASMVPLFATSLSSQDATMHVMNPNVLRTTVSTLEFQPTQLAPHSSKQFTSPSTSSLFSLKEEEENSDGVFKNPNTVLREGTIRSRRFIKNKSKISRYFADVEVKKSLKQEELRKERIYKSEKSVNLCRKYRIGEYPDIEITLSSVINPLQALVLCDAPLARHLYTSLFISLMTHIKQTKINDAQFIENIKQSINHVLSNSTEFAPNTIGAFLDIALVYKNEMQFDPAIISNVSEESGLLSIGSLLLEEYLNMNVSEPTPAKRTKGVETADTYCWVKLAELYKEMNEWDVVTAIFMEKMNCNDTVVKAIEAESTGHWRAARGFYAQVIQEDTSRERRDFYYESYFKSFAALGEWDELANAIDYNVCTNENDNTWNLLWDDNWNQHKLLPWYITAGLRNRLLGGNRDIFTEINECLQDPHKSEYLKTNFGEELAMLCLLQDDCDTANYYLSNTVTKWLENWTHLNPLFLKLRANTLFNLKGVIDLYLFINFIDNLKTENCKANVEILLKSWTESYIDSMESLLQSETATVYRNQFITVIQQKLLTILPEEKDFIKKDLNAHKFKLHINLTERALEQENYYVARKYVKIASKFKEFGDFENMRLPLAFSKIIYFMSQTSEDENKMKILLDSWERLGTPSDDSITTDNRLCYIIKIKLHIYELTQKIHGVLLNDDDLYNQNKSSLQKLMGNVALSGIDKIWEYGVNELKSALKYCEDEVQMMMNTDNLQIFSNMAEAYVKLAYCTQYRENMDETFIVCVSRAMLLGSSEGKQLFPCLLNKNIAEFRNTFKLETSKIPTWMFLKWIPQLLANLDTSCIYAIDNIILEIAKMYPQAIMFPYRISREKYKFEPGGIENLGKTLMQKLNELLLPDELMENFLKAISCVTPPVNVLMYYLKKLGTCNTEQEFKNALQNLLDDVFLENEKYIGYRDSKSMKGLMFKEIAGYEAKLRAFFKGKFDLAVIKNKVSEMQNALSNYKFKRSIKLVDYSPWLSNFQASELRGNLEIPGQYTGENRPLVQYHTKIMGFSPSVFLLDSLRAPIRITILGNDAKEYNYLIKFGEDLRQDQRIEQIFILMNNVLLQDSNCNKRQMNIATYQVVPLNNCLGVIEWLNDTTHLQNFIESGLSDKKVIEKSLGKYKTWIGKTVPKKLNNPNNVQIYGIASLRYKDIDFMGKYTELVNCVEAEVLSKSFWNISINSESFFALRQKFVVSYAVICISHWLLGIGDRHLQNTLISLRNGGAIGIDFGYAFGAGTQILPIPELVPFRLTPHILNLLQPLGEHGLLQECMIHCMRAFRKRSNILLATMNVFIQEPSIDWIEFARRSEITSGSTIKKSWYPEQKIAHAKRKLAGNNPVNIMTEELTAGHSHNIPLRDIYIEAVKGKANNFRATVNDNLTEEDQVKCLIDHATDYNVLGRMFEGWLAWI